MKNLYLVFCLSMVFTSQLMAGHIKYVWSAEHEQMPKGEFVIEQGSVFQPAKLGNKNQIDMSGMAVDLFYGVSEKVDLCLSQLFSHNGINGMNYDGLGLKGRIDIIDRGEYFIDPMLVVELTSFNEFTDLEFTPRLILSKDINCFNLTLNLMNTIMKEENIKYYYNYSFGASYNLSELITGGLEMMSDGKDHYIGPTFAHGSDKICFCLNILFKLNKNDNSVKKFQIGTVIGLTL
jgi:hypothetical protein